MIYARPLPEDQIDQGDIVDSCPLLWPDVWDLDRTPALVADEARHRVIVVSQTCDLANQKTDRATIAVLVDAQKVVDDKELKAADIKGMVRAGRVWGWYFLPKSEDHGLTEMIVDLRQLHTVRLDMLRALCLRGQRKARLQPLYREHLNQRFANSYARIGLPQPYPTD